MLKVKLGNTKFEVSRAGFGVLPIGPGQLALPVDEGARIICYAIKQGINFFDTAQYYHTYPYLRKALEMMPESEIIISSKSLAETYDEMMEAIAHAQQSLGRDVIDIFLMHEVRTGQLDERAGAWQALIDARAAGTVRAIGLSTHHADVTQLAASIPEVDVVFPLINYAGLGIRWESGPATADQMMEAIRACHAAGKGVYAMKAFGGGNLTTTYQKSLDFVFGQPEIDSVMIGFGSASEIDDLISYMSGSMAKDYNPDTSHKKIHINQGDCLGCGACKARCPNGAIFWNEKGLAQVDQSVCLTCGYCSYACPVRAIIMY
ncbi:MAG: aldo/keto reductase [Firmicutes bacterium]|nr:aldo/keto reductase [Bacillota bacterium]